MRAHTQTYRRTTDKPPVLRPPRRAHVHRATDRASCPLTAVAIATLAPRRHALSRGTTRPTLRDKSVTSAVARKRRPRAAPPRATRHARRARCTTSRIVAFARAFGPAAAATLMRHCVASAWPARCACSSRVPPIARAARVPPIACAAHCACATSARLLLLRRAIHGPPRPRTHRHVGARLCSVCQWVHVALVGTQQSADDPVQPICTTCRHGPRMDVHRRPAWCAHKPLPKNPTAPFVPWLPRSRGAPMRWCHRARDTRSHRAARMAQ